MAKRPYDPQKRREYYLRTRQLKGRHGSTKIRKATRAAGKTASRSTTSPAAKRAQERKRRQAKVARLKEKVTKLEGALTRARQALAEKRRNEREEKRKNSDGKTTIQERQASKEYRERNRSKIQRESSASSRSSGGSSSSGASSSKTRSKSLNEMDSSEILDRINKIENTLSNARRQLSKASTEGGIVRHAEDSGLGWVLHSHISRKESVQMTADFGGYATRNDVRCSDGRTILADAFKDNDGVYVPLVWQHGHNDPNNVLGHVKLENRADGVYAYGFFNSTPAGQQAKKLVQHGDIKKLSIFANQLSERVRDAAKGFKDVVKGNIREVSLVLAGANEGAYIDHVNMVHSDGTFDVDFSEAVIHMGQPIELMHADKSDESDSEDDDEKTLNDILETLNEEQTDAVNYLLMQALESGAEHSDTGEGESDEDDAESDAEGDAEGDEVEDSEESSDSDNGSTDEDEAGEDAQHDNTSSQEDSSMTHNIFDQAKKTGPAHEQIVLKHDDIQSIVSSAVKGGSLKDAVEDYALQHGIENIDYLFPDAKTIESSPAFISRRMEWVDKVLSSVRKSPFSRIKTITADITPDEARARGYIKGNMKNEEFFALSKRETTPQTIYKKQKLDRDDVIDIVDLDVVAWLKAEMKVMLDEEIAGAILVGDGRSIGDDDKIKETNIRPIASDAELYVTTVNVNMLDANSSVEELVDSVIENRRHYKGTGQPTFYTTEAVISKFLTVKDNFGRRIYASLQEVAAVLRVADIVPVEVMERVPDLVGIMVNLADYTLGADRGGQATMFDDFDIDYNKLRYLIETRLSGALTTPKSALVFRQTEATSVQVTPVAPSFDGTTVTVPTVTGVIYKNADDDTTLTTGDPVELGDGEVLMVIAVPASGYHFPTNATEDWTFTGQG